VEWNIIPPTRHAVQAARLAFRTAASSPTGRNFNARQCGLVVMLEKMEEKEEEQEV
jgi:hypothetical protein